MIEPCEYHVEHDSGAHITLTGEQGRAMFILATASRPNHGDVVAHLVIRVPLNRQCVEALKARGVLHHALRD